MQGVSHQQECLQSASEVALPSLGSAGSELFSPLTYDALTVLGLANSQIGLGLRHGLDAAEPEPACPQSQDSFEGCLPLSDAL